MMPTCYAPSMARNLDVHEAAEVIGVSVATAHVMIRDGRMQAQRSSGPGQPYRIAPAEAERVRRSRTVTDEDLAEAVRAQEELKAAEQAKKEAQERYYAAIARTHERLTARWERDTTGRAQGVSGAIADALKIHRGTVADIVKAQREST